MKTVLDVCCGARACWFQPNCRDAEFCDIRDEEVTLCDGRIYKVHPDRIADFRQLPHEDSSMDLVLFDPPHLLHAGAQSWLRKKYGLLSDDWMNDISRGFCECWRVLRAGGTLVFKWSEEQVALSSVLPLAPAKPLFGHRRGKTMFLVFYKSREEAQHE